MNSLVWYGLKNGTDLWQVVDAGVAQLLKNLIAKEHNEWLDKDENYGLLIIYGFVMRKSLLHLNAVYL